MPHIIILDQWKDRINTLHTRAETLGDNIDNGMYVAKQLEEAEALMADIETSVSADLNADAIDVVIRAVEQFLG